MQPAISVQALQSSVRITLQGDRVMVISVRASNAVPVTRAAAAVADSYVAYVGGKNAPRGTGVQYVSSAAPRPGSADVLETSGLGALCGALIGAAVGAVALIPRRRRLRMT